MAEMAGGRGAGAIQAMAPEERRKQMMRAVVASTVGTSIEWYDYFLFGTMAGLVFPHLFFPKSDALAGTLNSYAIFFVGDRKSTRLNSSHVSISYAVFCLKKKKRHHEHRED